MHTANDQQNIPLPAYILADKAYDVWLANARGNRYSRAHRTLDPNDIKFWNFRFGIDCKALSIFINKSYHYYVIFQEMFIAKFTSKRAVVGK